MVTAIILRPRLALLHTIWYVSIDTLWSKSKVPVNLLDKGEYVKICEMKGQKRSKIPGIHQYDKENSRNLIPRDRRSSLETYIHLVICSLLLLPPLLIVKEISPCMWEFPTDSSTYFLKLIAHSILWKWSDWWASYRTHMAKIMKKEKKKSTSKEKFKHSSSSFLFFPGSSSQW